MFYMEGSMIILTTDTDKFKSNCPDIYLLDFQIDSATIQHEIMMNDKFKESLCEELLEKYGVFACGQRWLLTDDILKSHLSCILDFGNSEEYNIQGYKDYFGRVTSLKDKVFTTCEEFYNYIQSEQVGIKRSHTMKDFGALNILKILRYTGGFIMPNIEESIRIAMKELGIDMGESNEGGTDSISDDTTETMDSIEEVVEETEENVASDVDSCDEESNSSVYLKIKGDSVALIFDSDFKFQRKELGGQPMNVLTFRMPDITSEKLQELKLIVEDESNAEPVKETKKTEVTKKSVKRIPIVTDTPTVEEGSRDELAELKNQKAMLDSQIKEARSKGDLELVNSLRKQRRVVRNKINSMGG